MLLRTLLLPLALCVIATYARISLAECPAAPSEQRTTQSLSPGSEKAVQLAADAQRRVSEQKFNALGFGDSIMFGWPQDLLIQALGAPVLDAAIGGGTDTLLWQLAHGDWSEQSPHQVLLLIGTNNLGKGACQVLWGIEADVAALHQKFPAARVIVVGILPRGPNLGDWVSEISQANDSLKANAAKNNYLFLDAHDALLCNHHTPCDLFDSSNLHLTRAGYVLLTSHLLKLLGDDGSSNRER